MEEIKRKDVVTCIYLLIKLKEIGFADGNCPTLTPKGFEEAMIFQDEGYKVTKDTLLTWLPAMGVTVETEKVAELAMYMQEKGYETVKRESDNLKKPWYLRMFKK